MFHDSSSVFDSKKITLTFIKRNDKENETKRFVKQNNAKRDRKKFNLI